MEGELGETASSSEDILDPNLCKPVSFKSTGPKSA